MTALETAAATFFLITYASGIGVLAAAVVQAMYRLRRQRAERELARLTAALPPDRIDLTGWPQRLTPSDLPGIGATTELVAFPLGSRLLVAEPAPLVVAQLHVSGGRHRLGEALGSAAQQSMWNSPTGQFWLIVDLGDLWEPCSHCGAPEDGEPAHAGCPGCACPCSLVETAPVVDLQALRVRGAVPTVAEVDDEWWAAEVMAS